MPIQVHIPTPLRRLTREQATVAAAGANIGELIEDLERQFPGFKERLCDQQGELRRFVNVYLNDEDIRFAQGRGTALKDGDEVAIIPAIAGGTEG